MSGKIGRKHIRCKSDARHRSWQCSYSDARQIRTRTCQARSLFGYTGIMTSNIKSMRVVHPEPTNPDSTVRGHPHRLHRRLVVKNLQQRERSTLCRHGLKGTIHRCADNLTARWATSRSRWATRRSRWAFHNLDGHQVSVT